MMVTFMIIFLKYKCKLQPQHAASTKSALASRRRRILSKHGRWSECPSSRWHASCCPQKMEEKAGRCREQVEVASLAVEAEAAHYLASHTAFAWAKVFEEHQAHPRLLSDRVEVQKSLCAAPAASDALRRLSIMFSPG